MNPAAPHTGAAPTPPPLDPLEMHTKHGWAKRMRIDPGLFDELVAGNFLAYVLLPGRSRRLYTRADVETALDGDLDDFILAYLRMQQEQGETA